MAWAGRPRFIERKQGWGGIYHAGCRQSGQKFAALHSESFCICSVLCRLFHAVFHALIFFADMTTCLVNVNLKLMSGKAPDWPFPACGASLTRQLAKRQRQQAIRQQSPSGLCAWEGLYGLPAFGLKPQRKIDEIGRSGGVTRKKHISGIK